LNGARDDDREWSREMTTMTAPGKERQAKLGRRDFLRALGVGASAAAAGAGSVASPARADNESDDQKRKSRYRETEEVKTYYRVNRYPK
jgi:hypothetical protein